MKNKPSYLSFLFLLLVFILSNCHTRTKTVWLDELDVSNADQATGIVRNNQSMWQTPLIIAGDTFKRGVGTHASGILRINLDGKTEHFSTMVGIDDSAPQNELAQASAEFIIIGDNKVLWKSGIMHGGDKALKAEVNTKGIKSLILCIDHCGDGISGDRTDWVNARFVFHGDTPYTIKRPKEAEYILTPPEPKTPRINAPYIHGARPGNPFLFNLPISGERPLNITAKNLPKSLHLDAQTGIITGTAPNTGEYIITVTAENKYGKDIHDITIKSGNEISLTPPMGWNSWNVFGTDIDDKKIREIADAMVELGLPKYGYTYINIDDGWQGKRGGKYNAIMPNEKFPDMKNLVEYIHKKGLKIGIYSSPWVQTFAGYIGGSADTPDGKINKPGRRTGAYSFAENDVKQWCEWGFDYLKYDWVTNDVKNTSEMSKLLAHSGRDIVFSISNAAPFELANKWAELTNVWRTTGDIHDSWCSMTTIGFLQDKWQPYAGPGHWNDPDMLIVGKVGWGDEIRTTRLSPNEQYTHITLWSILAAPLLIGCDLRLIDDFTLNLLKNNEVIAVNQDPAGIQGHRVYFDKEKQIEVWARPLNDGSWAIGLFNLGEEQQPISITWDELSISGKQIIRNLWEQKNMGIFDNEYTANVPSHGTIFIKITPYK